jgi:hypothetical protein
MSKVIRIGKEVVMNCPWNGHWNCPKNNHTKDCENPPHKSETHSSHPWKQNSMMTRRDNNK